MNPVDYLGAYLSQISGKNPMASKGLIRLAIKRKFGDQDPNTLEYRQLKTVCEEELSQLFNSIFPSDGTKFLDQILTRLEEIQSVFTLG